MPSIPELRRMSSAALDEAYEQYHRENPVVLSSNSIRQEIEWRSQSESSKRVAAMTENMERMTAQIRDMTKTIKWLTAAAVFFGVISVAISTCALIGSWNEFFGL